MNVSAGSSVVIPSPDWAATRTAALLHERIPGIRVFVGGPVVTSAGDALAIGADEFGATALDVATRCVELAAR